MLTFFYLLLAGLLGGFMAGLIGVGGGLIYVFILPIALKFMGVPDGELAQYTIANSIFAIFFASTSANYALFKRKDFYYRPVLLIGFFSALSSIATLHFVVNTEWFSVREFNIAVIVLLIYMLIYTLINAKNNFSASFENITLPQYAFIGFCSGTVASVSGLGGGIVIIPLLNSVMKVDIKKSSYVSSGVIMLTSFVMTLFNLTEEVRFPFHNYNLGYIVFPVGIALSAGVLFTSAYGVRTAAKLSPKTISYIYAVVLGIVIVKKATELIYSYS